tara:strand:- start:1521 stop:1838 length:318 start_codon:yes stop_codon:yes gene_type:complete
MDTAIVEQNITTYLTPALALLISGVIALWFKELVGDLVASIRWKMKPGFEPGDVVYLDGERATIISIGLTESTFEIDNGRGKVWRYIKNTRIQTHRLEQIISEKK